MTICFGKHRKAFQVFKGTVFFENLPGAQRRRLELAFNPKPGIHQDILEAQELVDVSFEQFSRAIDATKSQVVQALLTGDYHVIQKHGTDNPIELSKLVSEWDNAMSIMSKRDRVDVARKAENSREGVGQRSANQKLQEKFGVAGTPKVAGKDFKVEKTAKKEKVRA